jgi:hypothetical protein
LESHRTVEIPFLGKFVIKESRALFMPNLEFITAGHFKLEENGANISPLSN